MEADGEREGRVKGKGKVRKPVYNHVIGRKGMGRKIVHGGRLRVGGEGETGAGQRGR